MPTARTFAPLLLFAFAGLSAGTALLPAAVAAPDLPVPALPSATRGPVAVVFDPGGKLAFVAESDDGTVAVVDVPTGKVMRRLPTGGKQPSALAYHPGGTLVVANTFSGSVAVFDVRSGKRTGLVPLRGEPSGVAITADGKRVFVSVPQLDEVAALDLPEAKLARRIPVGKQPRPLALTPDGRTLLVANSRGGDVSFVDTDALAEKRRVSLTGVNLRGLSLSADGRRAYVTGQIPANSRATREPLDIWTNTLFTIDLERSAPSSDSLRADVGAEGRLDFFQAPSPDPDGVAAIGSDLAAVTLGGSDETLLVRATGPFLRTFDPQIVKRVPVGARPRGLALTPDRTQLWVANELDSSLSVLEVPAMRVVRKIELGIPIRRERRLEGRYLFGSARLTKGRQFTCTSCHPNGNTDGLTWELAHVPDGLRFRNSRNLRGGITLTAPFRWSGHDQDIEEFFQEEITGLLQGPRQNHNALHALWNLLDQFPMPPNPYRDEGDRFSAVAKRGKQLFEGKAGCIQCHSGEMSGGTGMKAFVGTTLEGQQLDVPHLLGVYDSAPYLHDGRAATLEEIFQKYNPTQEHGRAHKLSKEELANVLRYVREL
jgi:DNA-binding beta-propeller fold protein YncE/mono/diheme cytochrome c family protein